MARLGGFEKHPTVAVAVSGGADSMALAVLADRWARKRHGKIIALTVDHGLRSESQSEAKLAHKRLSIRDIDCQLLVWHGDKPTSGIQAAAREARYRLMGNWCRRQGVLHLLVAHHREDQAETILSRLARASGADGLAGMAAIHEVPDIRLLRPCLSLPGDRLRAVLLKYKIDWSEDPSNEDTMYERVRLRALLPLLASEGVDAEALSGTARRMAAVRAGLEAATADFLGAHAEIFPEGYASFDRAAFLTVDPEIGRRVLIALLTTIGGNVYPPRHAKLEALCETMRQDGERGSRSGSRTLGGCRIVPVGSEYLICREAGRCEVVTATAGTGILWDNRFFIRLPGTRSKPANTYTIKPLEEAGWAAIRQKITDPIAEFLPKAVSLALPAIQYRGKIVAVPHLNFNNLASAGLLDVQFMPTKPATSPRLLVV